MKNEYLSCLRRPPQAQAVIRGSEKYPDIFGVATFWQMRNGVMILTEVTGLPMGERCREPIFAYHIHAGGACTGYADDPFADADGHYNPDGCPHPYHAGDMPPLFGAAGRAFSMFFTDRITVGDVIGRSVVIHASPDDFTTQPAGNAGEKIACGVIMKKR